IGLRHRVREAVTSYSLRSWWRTADKDELPPKLIGHGCRIPVRMTAKPHGAVVPPRVRYGVLYFGIALAVIQYIDRVCISWSMPDIREALGLVGAEHDDAVGWIFSAFTLA